MKNGTRNTNGAVAPNPSVELRAQIKVRAYELWEAEGGQSGNDLNHWLQAERELLEPARLRGAQQRNSQC
jgi:hypothetical protein